jgi:hypothetical protein
MYTIFILMKRRKRDVEKHFASWGGGSFKKVEKHWSIIYLDHKYGNNFFFIVSFPLKYKLLELFW